MRYECNALPKSDRLQFRLPAPGDTSFYLKLTQSPDYIRFISDAGLKTAEDAEEYIHSKMLKRFEDHGVGLWVAELKETGTPVGTCGLVVRDELPFPDLGYALLEEYRGCGFAREAGGAVLDLASSHLKLDTLCAIIATDNHKSAAVLKDLGFVQDGQRFLEQIGEISDYFVRKDIRHC